MFELEHGLHDPSTDVTGDDPIRTGKIALAHLNEFAGSVSCILFGSSLFRVYFFIDHFI